MVLSVSTTVVDIVWTTLHVTNRLNTMTGDVNLDILTGTVAKVRLPMSALKLLTFFCLIVQTHTLNTLINKFQLIV